MKLCRSSVATAAATVLAALAVAPAAHADDTQVFAPWGDPSSYALAPGGDAESAAGWTFAGDAGIVAGNESFFVHGPADASSVHLGPGASATTATTAVAANDPTLRFFARSSGTSLGSVLRVDVSIDTPSGTVRVPVGVVTPTGGGWTPSPVMPILANAVSYVTGSVTPARLSFVPMGRGTWSVDDVYVDPWRNG